MKKDPIDKLFEEKLKDYSEVPDDKVWKAIEASLDGKKKSRKVIPLWWKLGGAAALLALVFYLIDPMGFRPETEEQVTDTEETRLPVEKRNDLRNRESIISGEEDSSDTVTDARESQKNRADSSSAVSDKTGRANTYEAEKAVAARRSSSDKNSSNTLSDSSSTTKKGDTANTGAPDEKKNETQLAENRQLTRPTQQLRPKIAGEMAKEDPATGALPDKRQEVTQVPESEQEKSSDRKSIFEEISEKEQEDALAENKGSRWSLGPRVAPVYFNSFGQGSPIHSNFVANSKSGNVNFSYGLSLSYNISPKLSIRSGVHKVDYGYDTNDISFSPTLVAATGKQINNIDYALTSRNLVVRNASQAKAQLDALSAEISAEFPSREGRMVQQFGYVEVPLELNLSLIESKLGVHLIGGLSSLFLIDNSVTLESDGTATEMGEANNLNPLNFSTNIGIGLEYEIAPRIQLNLEPVFKYQLNTFSDSAGDFNPYSIGIYSGLNFRF
jgi:hypothetical protein